MQTARCYVEISRSRIASNYRAVRDAVRPGVEVMGVVKADAYGHGSVEVSRVLTKEGARWLAVSSVDEGIVLRRAGIDCRILVMAGVMPWERSALREHRLTPAVHSLSELADFGSDTGEPFDVHLKIDTGLNRLGAQAGAGEIVAAIRAARGVRVEGLMTHFASAADFISQQTEEQIRLFDGTVAALAEAGIRPALTHCAGTNAIAYLRPGAPKTMVRPGHAIYGYVSPGRGQAPHATFRVEPALSWKTHIVTVKDIPARSKVGYGGSFVAPAPMRIAVLAAGYADGIPHRLSNKGKVIAGGRFAPILGTVSMDLTTIDISASPHLRAGDEVTLLGREGDVSLDAQQIARTAGTISYNVLCSISARVRRCYVD
ncbi:MAG TPA: alanine racemase [Bryobacteraceae bacterium]|nr:alanine racemase [Bryobacteraceae bacterium]